MNVNEPSQEENDPKPNLDSDKNYNEEMERLFDRKKTITRVIDKLLEKLNPPPTNHKP